jgi:hypothetical protein
MFPPDEPIVIGYEEMHRLSILVKQDRARLMYAWVGIDNPPAPPEHLVDFAIQRGKPSTPMA